jgi:hypothetical protein
VSPDNARKRDAKVVIVVLITARSQSQHSEIGPSNSVADKALVESACDITSGRTGGETDPEFGTKARKDLMLAGTVGFLVCAMWVKTIGRAVKTLQSG